MKVLFVFSGNSTFFSISPFIQSQAESLRKLGHTIDYYPIKGKGIGGYISNIPQLKHFIKKGNYDLIHAHYSLCIMVAILCFVKVPIVGSFMGNDILGEYNSKGKFLIKSLPIMLLSILVQPFLSYAICKSKDMSKLIYFVPYQIIPNGIDLEIFKPLTLRLDINKKRILFLGNRYDINKNYKLLNEAIKYIKHYNIEIIAPYPLPQSQIVELFSEVDVFVLCSIVEGSPNVIKEAMACNCPIVATNVGDVSWLLGNLEGHYICKHNPIDLASKIEQAIEFGQRTEGRRRIIELKLDSESIAKRIEKVYEIIKRR
mgnify:CR=1 FL=1